MQLSFIDKGRSEQIKRKKTHALKMIKLQLLSTEYHNQMHRPLNHKKQGKKVHIITDIEHIHMNEKIKEKKKQIKISTRRKS